MAKIPIPTTAIIAFRSSHCSLNSVQFTKLLHIVRTRTVMTEVASFHIFYQSDDETIESKHAALLKKQKLLFS